MAKLKQKRKAISNTEFNKVISEAFKDPYSRQEERRLIKKHNFDDDERAKIREMMKAKAQAQAHKSVRRYVRSKLI